jgi:Flp pilus assembly protein TadG
MPFLRRPRAALRRFARARRGALAVEFALLLPVLLILTFGLTEILISFLIATTLETAVATAARDIRTGRFQDANASNSDAIAIDAFKTRVCDGIAWLSGDCKARLHVTSRVFATFPALRNQLDAGLQPNSSCWQTGAARQIVLVTASFRWKVVTPLLRPMLGETPDGQQTMNTMAVFQNEPFERTAPPPPLCP